MLQKPELLEQEDIGLTTGGRNLRFNLHNFVKNQFTQKALNINSKAPNTFCLQ